MKRALGRALVVVAMAATFMSVPASSQAVLQGNMYLVSASKQVMRNGESYDNLSVACPSGTTPAWGGYYDSLGDDIRRIDEFFGYGSGASYSVDIVDYSPAVVYGFTQVTVQAMCISLSNFSDHKVVTSSPFVDSASHLALGIVNCGSGWTALGVSVFFNSFDSTVLTSSPFNDKTSWVVRGWIGTNGKQMTMSVNCVKGASLDALRVYGHSDAVGWPSDASATCPAGFTMLTGGTYHQGDGQAITIDPRLVNRTLQSRSLGDNGTMVTTVVCLPTSSPQVTVTGAAVPELTSTSAQWQFTATDPAAVGGYGLSTSCMLQDVVADWEVVYDHACTSPVTESGLHEGPFMLTVTATTSDGRWAASSWPVTIDHSPPVVDYVDPPGTPHPSSAVDVAAQLSDSFSLITGLTCAIDAGEPASCGTAEHGTSPHEPGCSGGCYFYRNTQHFGFSGLPDGAHVLHVHATDSRTNTITADLPFLVDTTPPSVTASLPTARFTVGTSVAFKWAGQDATSGIASYAVRWQRAAYNGDFGAWSAPVAGITGTSRTFTGLLAGSTYCYQVQAKDRAGHFSSWTAARCTAIPLDDRALAESSGWSAIKPAGYFKGTAMVTSTRGQTLTATGVNTRRVAVVAKTCPTCGVVGVFVGGVKIGEVNLKAATTSRKVISLPAFAPREGVKVVVKVLSTGKVVQIDALGLSQR